MRYLIHNSPRGNRESILERGLEPHQPMVDGNWRSLADELYLRGPRGVYALAWDYGEPPTSVDDLEYRESTDWGAPPFRDPYSGYRVPGHELESLDQWLVDADGLPVEGDPDWNDGMGGGSSRVIPVPVPPERLTLLSR